MKEKEIFEQFLKASQINKDDVIDYRLCTKFYAGIHVNNSIIVQLKKDKYEINHIIYTAYDIDNVVNELKQTTGNKTPFEQGFHYALDEVKQFGKELEHISIN